MARIGGLAPERRAEVARFRRKAWPAGTPVNLSNAAIARLVAG
jgi:nucleoside permease NupC